MHCSRWFRVLDGGRKSGVTVADKYRATIARHKKRPWENICLNLFLYTRTS